MTVGTKGVSEGRQYGVRWWHFDQGLLNGSKSRQSTPEPEPEPGVEWYKATKCRILRVHELLQAGGDTQGYTNLGRFLSEKQAPLVFPGVLVFLRITSRNRDRQKNERPWFFVCGSSRLLLCRVAFGCSFQKQLPEMQKTTPQNADKNRPYCQMDMFCRWCIVSR